MFKAGMLIASSLLGVFIALVFFQQWPDIRRYLRIRAM